MKGVEFIKNMIKYCIPSVFSAVMGILVIPIITTIYPADEYGKINLFYSVANTVSTFAVLGFDSAYLRFYYEPPDGYSSHRIFKVSLYIGISVSLIIFLICGLFFKDSISQYLFGEENNILLASMLIYVIGLILMKFVGYEYRMAQNARMYNWSQIVSFFTNRISFVCFSAVSTSYICGNWTLAISTFIAGIIFLYVVEKRRYQLEFPLYFFSSSTWELFKFGFPLMPATLMVWMNNSVAKFLYSYLKDYSAIGTFSIATSVANVFSIVPAAFTTYWSPFIYKNYKTENDFIKIIHDYVVLASVWLLMLFWAFQDVLYTFVGDSYKMSQEIFLLIMINPILSLISETTCYGIMIAKKTRYNLYVSIVSFAINIAITYATYSAIGIWGAGLGVSITALVQFLIKTVIGQKYYKTIAVPTRTAFSIGIIIFVAMLNIRFYSDFAVRTAIFFLVIIYSAVAYKNNFEEIRMFMKNKIKEWRKQVW